MLEKACEDVVAYQARVEYMEDMLATSDMSKKLCWKDSLSKITPWRLHKVTEKCRLFDLQLLMK